MLNPDFPFEYISCDPYIKTVVVSEREIEDYKDIVKIEKADRLEWHRYQQTTYWQSFSLLFFSKEYPYLYTYPSQSAVNVWLVHVRPKQGQPPTQLS